MRRTAAASTVTMAPFLISAQALGLEEKAPASGRLRIALIGCGRMGRENVQICGKNADVEIAALCDVWKSRLDRAGERYPSAKRYHDYRKMLDDQSLDGVIIATPPHWHCRQTVDACEAGKDIYLQKPMSLHLSESLAVRNAVRKHDRICQIGTQIHATENYRRVVEWIRSGKLGHVSVVRTFNVMNQGPNGIGYAPKTGAPVDLDWNQWLGPYAERSYNALLASNASNHCWFMDYSGGWTCGMGPHILDLPVWALDLGYPESVYSTGGRFGSDCDGDAPDTQEVTWKYPKMAMTWWMSTVNSFGFDFGRGKPSRRLGVYFQGGRGTMYCDYRKHEVVPEGNLLTDTTPPEKSIPPSPGHEREWLDSIKSRKQTTCSAEYHSKVDVPLVLANLSQNLGRTIRFDGQTEQIVGDEEAARLSVPEYRSPWKFPHEYL
ncbi:MAG: Gfo/Idh/MocA family oxidoreductase [Pirellulales bacterium]|nr:Gfo/Idh/MocA family oxidoreductase [Pirellulales bacterium]